jgi:hypothetical protein
MATKKSRLPKAVSEIARINFEGNVIPHSWYQHVKLSSGQPDLTAIIILAEIVYWYRPYQVLSETKGEPSYEKKFKGDMFQSAAGYYEKKFGLTKDQTRKALKRLEDLGLIRRELREITQRGVTMNNVMFIEPIASRIAVITYSSLNPNNDEQEQEQEHETKPEGCVTCSLAAAHSKTTPVQPAAALIFDFGLKDLSEYQRTQISANLAAVPNAQAVLDELNSNVIDGKVKARKPYIAYLKTLIARATRQDNEPFIATSDLPERRRKAAAVQRSQEESERKARERLSQTAKQPDKKHTEPPAAFKKFGKRAMEKL